MQLTKEDRSTNARPNMEGCLDIPIPRLRFGVRTDTFGLIHFGLNLRYFYLLFDRSGPSRIAYG